MTESEKRLWLDGAGGLKPYLRMKDGGMPKGKVEQIAWLLLNGSGCGFCKVCRDEPCNIKDGEKCTDNMAKYIRETVLNEVESELQQYRAIGTVEECREARERQIPKKTGQSYTNKYGNIKAECPSCYCAVMYPFNFCKWCGQKLNWSE